MWVRSLFVSLSILWHYFLILRHYFLILRHYFPILPLFPFQLLLTLLEIVDFFEVMATEIAPVVIRGTVRSDGQTCLFFVQ